MAPRRCMLVVLLLLHHKFQNNMYTRWCVSHIWLALLYDYDKIKTQTLRFWFHLLHGFTQTHTNTVYYNTLGLQCNVLMSCCFRYLLLLARRTLAVVVLGYKVRNCYALSVTHFICRPLRSYAITHFISNFVRARVRVSCASKCHYQKIVSMSCAHDGSARSIDRAARWVRAPAPHRPAAVLV